MVKSQARSCTIALLILSFLCPYRGICAKEPDDCLVKALATLGNPHPSRSIKLTYYVGKINDGKFLLAGNDWYDPDAIYLGVANTEAEGSHHYYLQVGKYHFSSPGFYFKSKVKSSKGKAAPVFFDGVLFKLKVSNEALKNIERGMQQSRRNLSCLHGVCDLLEKEGAIALTGVPSSKRRAKLVVSGLLSGNVKDLHSNSFIPVEMLTTSKRQLTHFLRAAQTSDREFARDFARDGVVYLALVPVAVASIVYWFFDIIQQDSNAINTYLRNNRRH